MPLGNHLFLSSEFSLQPLNSFETDKYTSVLPSFWNLFPSSLSLQTQPTKKKEQNFAQTIGYNIALSVITLKLRTSLDFDSDENAQTQRQLLRSACPAQCRGLQVQLITSVLRQISQWVPFIKCTNPPKAISFSLHFSSDFILRITERN